jgi:uncharacterized protein
MTRLARLALITSVALVSAAPAFAQSGPSFECAKASNDVERTICKDPKLAKADREMAAAYAALAAKLGGAAKENLEKEQVRWLGDRNRGCAADTDGIAPCLTRRYAARTTNLLASAEGIYPFISEQSLSKNAKLGKITYSYDISYPKFDGTSADFTAVNARFANAAKKAVADATPQADSGLDREQGWTYEQGFKIYRPSANARWSICARARSRVRAACSRRATSGSIPWSRSWAPTSRSSSSTSPASTKRWSPPASPSSCASPAATAGTPTGWR